MEVIWQGISPAYEKARLSRVWNLRCPDRYPIAIVHPKNESDIKESVEIARQLAKSIALRSGGHSYPVWSLRDNSILVDLGDYHGIEVDTQRLEARVSPSTKNNLDVYLYVNYGLIFGGGSAGNVGLGGYLLQGGMGMNFRNWGWGCERVKAVDVVTAEGKLVHCDSEENSDLFWAARGAGPGFPGIVTRFYLQLRPAPQVVRMSTYRFPAKLIQRACRWILGLLPSLDDTVDVQAAGIYSERSEEHFFLVFLTTFNHTTEGAYEALLLPHHSLPNGVVHELFCQESSIEKQQEEVKSTYFFADNVFLPEDVDIGSLLEDAVLGIMNEESSVGWTPMKRPSGHSLPDMALSLQPSHYISARASYQKESDGEVHISWVEHTIKKMAPFSVGTFLGETDFQYRNSKYWGASQTERLQRIRNDRDPEGRFCGYLGLKDSDLPQRKLEHPCRKELQAASFHIDEASVEKCLTRPVPIPFIRRRLGTTKVFLSSCVIILLVVQLSLVLTR